MSALRVTPEITDREIVQFVRAHQRRGQIVQLFASEPNETMPSKPDTQVSQGLGKAWLDMCAKMRETVGGFDLELPQRQQSRPLELW